MKKFIGYFDYLVFKSFIENNNLSIQIKIFNNILRDIERALGKGKYTNISHGIVSDLSESRINCINFSDTIVFWTNNDSIGSLNELLNAKCKFNLEAITCFSPVRGTIIYDVIE